ncbi:MAG: HlyD family efflux transporter periplasmic adaptor subunit, partial [Muribaculaceae bacterium]|nr:HlyD family efflux transporter periplasmic adaptor subunit [Muribaculaceae bacterium]
AYNTGRLELEQLRQQLVNERKVKDADVRVKQLELQISEKNLAEMKRTLADARILSPRRGVLTYINNQNGAQVARGTHVATVSDLSRFKVECEIADSYADRVATGGIAKIKTGRKVVGGTVGNVTPLSRNGVISFTVLLDDDSDPAMRSGLKTDVYVMCTVVNDATMIPNGSYYSGAGEYDMFVMVSDTELVRRRISLGASSYDKVEVTAGLQPGERIVISDLGRLKKNSNLKIR